MSRRRAPLLAAAFLLALLAIPASASARFSEDFAEAVKAVPDSDWKTYFSADLEASTKEPDEPDHAGYPGGHSVWMSWKMYKDQVVQARACGKDVEELLAVYTGTVLDQLTEVAATATQDSHGCAVLDFPVQAGVTYRVAVDAKGDPGDIYFRMYRYAPDDDFADAIVLSGLPTAVDSDPTLATTEPGEPDHPGGGEGNSIWYLWTAAESGRVHLYNCEYWSGAWFSVYTGAELGSLALVASGTGGGNACGNYGGARWNAVAGTTYAIAVEGYAGKGGTLGVYLGRDPEHPLTVNVTGNGGGTITSDPPGIDCGETCQADFYAGQETEGLAPVTLAATPAPGSVFKGWSGEGCSGTGSCHLKIPVKGAEVSAEFEAAPPLLAVKPPAVLLPAASAPAAEPKAPCAKKKGKKGKKGKKKRGKAKRHRCARR
ncbi:MAG TPA: hypothetical protein VFY75_04730 [Solirubrobacterales bacterium]|nr:hypothetical protein [Solirubrobacterales bacterium]